MQPNQQKQALLKTIAAIDAPALLVEIEAFTLSLTQPQSGLTEIGRLKIVL